ncbi:MAG TPA: sugar transferase [Syntrophorhabdus sp.]|nr:sugar transferase [Syntrophorhabdus sp.]
MVKRIFDIIASTIGLVVLGPCMFFIAWRIRYEDGGPVFYRGERMGLNGKPFRIFKFRSMVVNAEKVGPSSTSEDDARITKIGRFLRKYKLDELPQLINVLIGDMSVVGPRPQVKWATDLYTEEEKLILTVRPGITDYASILFHNEEEILKGSSDPDQDYLDKIHPTKTRLAMQYVQTHSFVVDMKIIFETITSVLNKSGG